MPTVDDLEFFFFAYYLFVMSPFLCYISVVVGLLLYVILNCLWELCACLCFVIHYFGSIIFLHHLEEEQKAGCFCYYCLTDVLLR